MFDTEIVCDKPEDTFKFGEELGRGLVAGALVLLYGDLGAGKTLLTKGILHGLGYDVDEVTSPSFTLVNLYKTPEFDVYHIDLWRLDNHADGAAAVGLAEILENQNAVTIIEWADRLDEFKLPGHAVRINIEGDGDEPRRISIKAVGPPPTRT
jgi:tRNA threonylcarbamoyladenosine biosynthesis protein TsaE